MLSKKDIILKLKELNLPKNEYALGTSGSMVMFGIKDYANDMDIDISLSLYNKFLNEGYKEKIYTPKEGYLARIIDLDDEVQLILREKIDLYNVVDIEGYSVYKLEKVREFKEFLGRDKDMKDILLIDKYLKYKKDLF